MDVEPSNLADGWGDYAHEYTWQEHRGSYLSGATTDNLIDHGSEDAARQACIALGAQGYIQHADPSKGRKAVPSTP